MKVEKLENILRARSLPVSGLVVRLEHSDLAMVCQEPTVQGPPMSPNYNRRNEIPGPCLVSAANRCGRGSSTAPRPATGFRNVMQTLRETSGFRPSSVGKTISIIAGVAQLNLAFTFASARPFC
jgi:hypothetical protein